jgi:hypothetical protein
MLALSRYRVLFSSGFPMLLKVAAVLKLTLYWAKKIPILLVLHKRFLKVVSSNMNKFLKAAESCIMVKHPSRFQRPVHPASRGLQKLSWDGASDFQDNWHN